ncbi:acyltransferase family protein [Microbulbifer sp. MCCC 1A16149]|uniref:acyltransferase family protein n=1 Tax=Microbulbifer sp. MCCC 1A16149 TaxID=3411322 RepID=UPI003D14223C
MNVIQTLKTTNSDERIIRSKRHITSEESDFIALARILMISGLVFHHVFTLTGSGFYPRGGIDVNSAHVADYLNGIVHWMSMAAVPCLSVISGYLFFKRDRVNYSELLHRRITTVLLPSIAWTSFWFFVAYFAYLWGEGKGVLEWIDYDFEKIGLGLYVEGVIGISRMPFAYQFWFVHDLVLTFALCPVIGWVMTRFPWVLPIALIPIWLLDINIFPFFSPNVLFFFTVGVFAATTRFDLTWLLGYLKPLHWVLALVFIVLILGRIFQDYHRVLGSYLYLCVLRGVGLLSFIAVVGSVTLSDNRSLRLLRYLSPFSFFIFAFHYPTLEFIREVIRQVPGYDTEFGLLVSFFILPLSCISISIAAALGLRWLSPLLFTFVNGGRAGKESEQKSTHANGLAVAR